jgi:threonyl-tRNA synthetase
MASIKLPDGSVRDVPDGTTVLQLAESIGKRLAQAAVVGRVDGKLVDVSHPLAGSHEVAIVTDKGRDGAVDPDALYVMRHSTAHVLAEALRHLYGAKLQYTIGPVIENGFFYDFEFPQGVSDLGRRPAEDRGRDAEDRRGRRAVQPRGGRARTGRRSCCTPRAAVQGRDHRRAGLRRRATVSIYRQGDFTDLCRGRMCRAPGGSRRSS